MLVHICRLERLKQTLTGNLKIFTFLKVVFPAGSCHVFSPLVFMASPAFFLFPFKGYFWRLKVDPFCANFLIFLLVFAYSGMSYCDFK